MYDEQITRPSIWSSLLWKEWHEHKWKLAALTAVLVLGGGLYVFSSLGLSKLDGMRTQIMFTHATHICYCVLAGAFLGMSTAGRESGRGTLTFLQSLPVPRWQLGITKLGAAVITAALPLLVFMYFVTLFYGGVGDSEGYFEFWGKSWNAPVWALLITIRSILAVSSIIIWMAAAGLNLSDEIRAGAIGFLVVSGIWMVLAFGIEEADKYHLQSLVAALGILMAAAPGGMGILMHEANTVSASYIALFTLVGLIGHAGVLTWYLRRYGRVVARPSRTDAEESSGIACDNLQLGPPMRSQFTAIAWKQVRETGPLALLAVGGVLSFTSLFWSIEKRYMGANQFGEILAGITLMVCFFVTLVTGIAIFLEELKPRMDDFWRSRPMNFALWFSVKYTVGLLVLVIAFGALLLLALWLTDLKLLSNNPQQTATVAMFGMIFLLLYTLSMATYCLLRQPIYAVVLTIGLLIVGTYATAWIGDSLPRQTDGWLAFLLIFGELIFFQACAMALAWKAVRNNWGLKG